MYIKTEGIILRTVDFQDHHQIHTLFSPDYGIVKLISNNGRSKKGNSRLSPLVQVDCIYKVGNSELCKIQEISIVNSFLDLRTSFSCLSTACELAQSILLSQLSGKPAPPLYQLFVCYLKKLPKMSHFDSLSCSFWLKILKYEGLIGEQIAKNDQNSSFTEKELNIINQLVLSRNFSHLDTLILPMDFHNKIKSFFIHQIS